MAKTRDGLRINKIMNLVDTIEGVSTRHGSNHSTILQYRGMRPCPVAKSTDARRMLVPWLRDVTGYNSVDIYQSLKSGQWSQNCYQ
tara:strand:+ start:3618 stop:3875 length:258 start_codon:yes stop_codon:yes gene_type:complete